MSLCLSVCPFSTKCSRALNPQFSVARESPGAGGVSRESPGAGGVSRESPGAGGVSRESPWAGGVARESPWAGGVARESPGAVRRYISTLNSDGHTDRQTDIRTCWAASSQPKNGAIPTQKFGVPLCTVASFYFYSV